MKKLDSLMLQMKYEAYGCNYDMTSKAVGVGQRKVMPPIRGDSSKDVKRKRLHVWLETKLSDILALKKLIAKEKSLELYKMPCPLPN